jgi:outer membrane protein OmpA-like peptidoglycan-associated protein
MIGACGERRRESKERRRRQREDGVFFDNNKLKLKMLSKKQLDRLEQQARDEANSAAVAEPQPEVQATSSVVDLCS